MLMAGGMQLSLREGGRDGREDRSLRIVREDGWGKRTGVKQVYSQSNLVGRTVLVALLTTDRWDAAPAD